VTVNPIGATHAPLATAPASPAVKSTSSPAKVTDTVQLSTVGQAAILSPQATMLEETDTHAQLLQSALSGDPVARSLLAALASIPPPQVP
jgi:hypothetical protein